MQTFSKCYPFLFPKTPPSPAKYINIRKVIKKNLLLLSPFIYTKTESEDELAVDNKVSAFSFFVDKKKESFSVLLLGMYTCMTWREKEEVEVKKEVHTHKFMCIMLI